MTHRRMNCENGPAVLASVQTIEKLNARMVLQSFLGQNSTMCIRSTSIMFSFEAIWDKLALGYCKRVNLESGLVHSP